MDQFKCSSFEVRDECVGETLDFTKPVKAIQYFTSDTVTVLTFILTIGCEMLAEDMTEF